jgi:hypothetical protein
MDLVIAPAFGKALTVNPASPHIAACPDVEAGWLLKGPQGTFSQLNSALESASRAGIIGYIVMV